ncbi:MAG: apolipoprotein N-acyltransferase [Thermodesulfobacteriota bacterium]
MPKTSAWLPGLRPALIAPAAGALLALAFPPLDLWPLALAGLAPLFWLARALPPIPAALAGWLFGVGLGLAQLHWLTVVMTVYGGLAWPLSVLALLGLAGIVAIYPAAFTGLMSWSRVGPAGAILLGAALWAGLEWVRGWLLTGFPWLPLSAALTSAPALIQSAELWGATGLSAALALVNGLVACALLPGGGLPRRARLAALAAAAILLAGGAWAGSARMAAVAGMAQAAPRLTVSVVQAGIEQDQLWRPEMRLNIIRRYVELTRTQAPAAAARPWLAVWPESAAPFYFLLEARESAPVLQLAQELEAFIALGSNGLVDRGPPIKASNRVWLVGPDGEPAGHYDKVHLVPFGEYVPLAEVFFFARAIAGLGIDFVPGRLGDTLAVGPAKVGPLICYESIFPELARAQRQKGATLLINQTNDAWYGRTGASYQHLSHLRLRAVENRVAVARAATTGVSGFVLPDGRVTDATRLFTPAAATQALPLLALPTLFTATGDLAGPLGLALGLAAAAWLDRRPRKRED